MVTGASSGIGRSFARSLAAAGLNLVLAARSSDRLENLGATLARAHGVEFRAVTVDLSRHESAAALVTATADLDVGLPVSNTGGGRPGLLLDESLDDLHRRFPPIVRYAKASLRSARVGPPTSPDDSCAP